MAEELEKARRQLQDAIETIAEGFAPFDAHDRMVMCNSRYRILFHEIADEVRPGNSFENVIRSAIGRGVFPAAEDDPEGWLASLLERRRHPTGPRETRMGSGIHLQVSDYKMKDGSHVSVYTDVSELRRRQDELMQAKAEAESALQRLQAAQKQLVTQEKMASLGQLTAGVARPRDAPRARKRRAREGGTDPLFLPQHRRAPRPTRAPRARLSPSTGSFAE